MMEVLGSSSSEEALVIQEAAAPAKIPSAIKHDGVISLAEGETVPQQSHHEQSKEPLCQLREHQSLIQRKKLETETLPHGWVRLESKTKPGSFYYAHPATKRTQVKRPVTAESERNSLYRDLPAATTNISDVLASIDKFQGSSLPAQSEPIKTNELDSARKRAKAESRREQTRKDALRKNKKTAEALMRAEAEAEAEEVAREQVVRKAREKRAQEQLLEGVAAAAEASDEQEEQDNSSQENEGVPQLKAKRKSGYDERRESAKRRGKAAGLLFGVGEPASLQPKSPDQKDSLCDSESQASTSELQKKKEATIKNTSKADKKKKKKLSKADKKLKKKLKKERKFKAKIKKAEQEVKRAAKELKKMTTGNGSSSSSSSSESVSSSSGT